MIFAVISYSPLLQKSLAKIMVSTVNFMVNFMDFFSHGDIMEDTWVFYIPWRLSHIYAI